jgi:hypothetical protein
MDTTAIVFRSYKMCILLYVEIICSMALHHRHVFDATTKQDQATTASLPVVKGNSEKIRFVG